MVSVIVYFAIMLVFFGVFILGLALLIFPIKILNWQERHFTETQEWVENSRIYKYFGIKVKSRRLYLWVYRIVGTGITVISGAALISLISSLF
jgi:hypothetical protein